MAGKQIGIACSRGDMPWSECHKCRLNPLHPCHLTPDMLNMIEKKETDHSKPNSFSPSRLTGCDRQAILMGTGDYYEDAKGAYPMIRGTMIHSVLEAGGVVPGYLQTIRESKLRTMIEVDGGQEKLEQDFNPSDASWVPGQEPFSGKPDLIMVREITLPEFPGEPSTYHVKIVDYKTTEITHDLIAAKREHVMQVNQYAWLVRRCLPEYLGLDVKIDVEELEIIYLSQKKTRRFTSAGWLTDNGKQLSRKDKTYEQLRLKPVSLLRDDTVEKWIKQRVRDKKAAEHRLPPIVDEDRNWMCFSCSVRVKCGELWREENAEAHA